MSRMTPETLWLLRKCDDVSVSVGVAVGRGRTQAPKYFLCLIGGGKWEDDLTGSARAAT